MHFHKSCRGAPRQLKLAFACSSEGGMLILELTRMKDDGYEKQSDELQGPECTQRASGMGSDEYALHPGCMEGFHATASVSTRCQGSTVDPL
jgi:hypothetical protein